MAVYGENKRHRDRRREKTCQSLALQKECGEGERRMLGKSSLRERRGKRGEVGAEVHALLASFFLACFAASFPREAQVKRVAMGKYCIRQGVLKYEVS